jgi:hypothetical protein
VNNVCCRGGSTVCTADSQCCSGSCSPTFKTCN